jgi:sugar-specific transcriptional regulator TrmB
MTYRFSRDWLIKKFHEIQRRILKAIDQLTDEQLNWKPNDSSHSISTLIRHIEGNIQERIEKGVLNRDTLRDRENEFALIPMTKFQLVTIIEERFDFIINSISKLTDEDLEKTQIVRNKERMNIDMLHQCAAHYSEHMGQIFYIAKQCINENYNSTSI